MRTNKTMSVSAVAMACAFILIALATSAPATAEQSIRGEYGGIAGDECVPGWRSFTAGGQVGVNNTVYALTVWNGDIIAGGLFSTAGEQTVNRIARWDGSAWHPLTSGGQIGVNNVVSTLAVWNGDLIAGGRFTTAGGQTVNRIARWDGLEWHPFESGGQIGVEGSGMGGPGIIDVSALTVWNGDLIAGGWFTTAGGQTVNRIARWDGTQWHSFESGGHVGVEGTGLGGDPEVFALTVWNGDLIVGGYFSTAGGQTMNNIARWDGSMWQTLSAGGQIGTGGSGGPYVIALTEWNGDLIAGGWFSSAGGQFMNHIARWDGSAWHPFTYGGFNGVSSHVYALAEWNGEIIIGGLFSMAGGQMVNHIARWDGSVWHPFTFGGQVGTNSYVFALTAWNLDVIACGNFTTAGGQTVNHTARWDGCIDEPSVPGDLNGDNVVDVLDLLILLSAWGVCPRQGQCLADLNNSGSVDVQDLLILLGNWG